MRKMSFTAKEIASAAEIYGRMLTDANFTFILTAGGSIGAAGCMQIYPDMVKTLAD
jgi:deoxyhypusine synthase